MSSSSSALSKQLSEIGIKQDLAIRSLSKICELRLDPTPEIYAIWYAYFQGNDCDFNKRIDTLLSKHEHIKTAHFQSILTPETKDHIALEEYYQDVSETLSDTFTNATEISGNSNKLGYFIEEISQNTEISQTHIIDNIVKESQHTMEVNHVLMKKLEAQQSKVDTLQEDYKRVCMELITDSLTQVYNRRHMDETLEKMVLRFKRHKKIFSMLIFDIDHFKQFNDNYGHQVGDTVLKFIGSTMQTIMPQFNDYLFRYGGEEFVVLFPSIGKFEASKLANQLANAISKKEITLKNSGENIGHITVSGGVAEFTKSDTVESFMKRADFSLYQAKKNGRNQIILS